MKILVTGSNGFIGKNLVQNLKVFEEFEIFEYSRQSVDNELENLIDCVDVIIHLAGENRPKTPKAFEESNFKLTKRITERIESLKKNRNKTVKIIFTSSIQALLDNPYGQSKAAAEKTLIDLNNKLPGSCCIYRLPGVFGKWAKPNYNSVVATFCYNIARDIPIHISNHEQTLKLVYIDDVIDELISKIKEEHWEQIWESVDNTFTVTIAELAEKITFFHKNRVNLLVGNVGFGIDRALYSTFLSFLPIEEKFKYKIPAHSDHRGVFVEMIKTHSCGQVSFFTANPGVTRGGHYHHSKTEKFLVISGKANFRFRNLISDEIVEFQLDGSEPEIVDTIPGWVHDITNIGEKQLVVLLWANEIFDKDRPDTYLEGL